MKNILFATLFLLSFSSKAQLNYTDAQGHKQGQWVKTYESGKKRYEGMFKNDIPVGHFKYYFEGEGGMMSEIMYRGTTGTGYAKAYHRNGVVQAEGIYRNQLKDSTWTYYDLQGVLTQREDFKGGELHGDQITYYENGAVAERISYEYGIEQGAWLRKWEDGTLRTKGTFEDGQLEGECKYFDEEGKLIAKGNYHNNKKHETWYYFEDNKVVRKETYRYGTLTGETLYNEESEE
jgi:antitoxin component YwqK of YwqJK toxin-antitoxin module